MEETGRKAVWVASGDLSHKLQTYGPYGFAAEGPEYDERIMDVCGRAAIGELFDFSESFCNRAAECGHRSFVMMAGAFDGVSVEAQKLSHEDVTGVGYGICIFRPGEANPARAFLDIREREQEKRLSENRRKCDPWVRLAWKSVEDYVRNRRVTEVPPDLPDELLNTRAGAFVSIHKLGQLRGCIGTISPFCPSKKAARGRPWSDMERYTRNRAIETREPAFRGKRGRGCLSNPAETCNPYLKNHFSMDSRSLARSSMMPRQGTMGGKSGTHQ